MSNKKCPFFWRRALGSLWAPAKKAAAARGRISQPKEPRRSDKKKNQKKRLVLARADKGGCLLSFTFLWEMGARSSSANTTTMT